jgi:hypothetical protein
VLGLVLNSRWVRRLSRGVPIARLLVLGELALMARRHLVRLDRSERRRLLTLLARARGRTGTLTGSERRELALLVARLEPRLFFGSAIKRLSPVPVPKRLLYGKRGSRARAALALTRRT